MFKAEIIGNLGADAVIRNFGGRDYISFNVAHSETFRDSQGVRHERTTWISCLRLGDANSGILPYLKKGTQVFLRGNITSKIYSNERGPQVGLNLNVSELQLLGSRAEGQSSAETTPMMPQVEEPQTSNYSGDEFPF